MTRLERTGIEFPDATWTSSDRYDRYGAIARCVRASLGPGRLRVLDVGDAAGYLRLFAGDLQLIGLDVWVQPDRLDGSVALVGDGGRLPFADQTFDAVVTSDVLEHVPATARPAFLAELSRVSRDLVVVAAPFDTEGVAGVEEIIRRFAAIATGRPQEQLEEHMEFGLPDLDAARAELAAHGPVVIAGNGNLWDWLELMLAKHQLLARPALLPFSHGIDLLCNLSLAGRAEEPPFYRHLVVARRTEAPDLGVPPVPPISSERAASLISSILTAAGPESIRQDVVPSLDHIVGSLPGFATRDDLELMRSAIDDRIGAIDGRLGGLETNLAYLRAQADRVTGMLKRIPGLRGRGAGRAQDDG